MKPSDTKKRALDLSTGVAAAYPSKLLCEIGWDVVKVEPEQGDPLRAVTSRWGADNGSAFAFVNMGKRFIRADNAMLIALAEHSDVVIGNFSAQGLAEAGLTRDLIHALRPSSVICSVSPFGLTGPKSNWVATDMIMQAASGMMFITGEYDQPPMQLPPYAAEMTGGLSAASAILAARRLYKQSGELQVLDISIVEAMTSLVHSQVSRYLKTGEVARREQKVKQALRMAPAADGFVYCAPGPVATVNMQGIAELLKEPRLAEDRFQTSEGRMRNWDEYLDLMIPIFATRTARHWFDAAESLHLTFALVQTVEELFQCPQLAFRKFWRRLERPDGKQVSIPGSPIRIDKISVNPRPASFNPGQHTEEIALEWLS